MPSVWYVGRWNEYNISTESWSSSVGSALPPQVWNAANGWSISHSVLTQEQLDMLEQMNDFRIGQADGPRQWPAPPAIADPEDDTASSYTYYLAIKAIVENFTPTNVTIDATNFVLKTPDGLKGAQFQIPAAQTTLTTRTHILPAVNSTLASLAGTEDLSNKTLTAPVLSGTVTGTYTLAGTPTITSSRINEILDTTGFRSVMFSPVASAVNYFRFAASASGSRLRIFADGSDADITFDIVPKGIGRAAVNNDTITTNTAAQVLTNKSLTSPNITGTPVFPSGVTFSAPRMNEIRDTNGALVISMPPQASAVNYFQVVTGATGAGVAINATGGDTNIANAFRSKGIGTVDLAGGDWVPVIRALPVASAVNYLQVTSAATTGEVNVRATGSDVNVNLTLQSRGTSSAIILRDGANARIATFASVASAVNRVDIGNSVSGTGPYIQGAGTDTNVDLRLLPQGTGRVIITQAHMAAPRITSGIFDASGNVSFGLSQPASAVNYLQFNAAIAGSSPGFQSLGSDADINLSMRPKGTGFITLRNSENSPVFNITGPPSTVNYVQYSAAISGASPSFTVLGTGDVGLQLVPKAAGNVQIYAATGQTPVLQATGADTNHHLFLMSKGSGSVYAVDSTGAAIARFIGNTSAVNFLNIQNSPAGSSLSIFAAGSDTNTNIVIQTKGLGQFFLRDGSGLNGLNIGFVASAVNYVGITNAVAGSPVQLQAVGTDTDIAIRLRSKGTGGVLLVDGASGPILLAQPSPSAVNYVIVRSSGATSPVSIEAAGTDTNVDLRLSGKGTGRIVGLTIIQHKTYTTAGRPSAVTAGAGAEYYDTTISKPVYSDGAIWRDAVGVAV